MKIFKVGLITVLVLIIIKAFKAFESAGEMDPNANVFAFAFIVSFFVLIIILTLFSGTRTKKSNGPKPMATRRR
ncbi:MAG TPA: hypothetical protein PLX95_01585 [bacterium]|nr:hypothetical protein [bacterium]